MTLALMVLGPVLRLGVLALLLDITAPADSAHLMPARPVIGITSVEDSQGRSVRKHLLVVDGEPFFPVGVSYHFTRHRDSWDDDLQSMRDLGLNTVRIDLGWRDVEPILPGHFRFSMLDEFLDRASYHGLYVIPVFSHTTRDFNTPLWFWALHGDWRVVDRDGNVPLDDLPCVNHPVYRDLQRRYMETAVDHIKGHPALLAYQVLNEPRYHQTELYDYNPLSISAFRRWLHQLYGSIDLLNEAWGTAYLSFDEAEPLRVAKNQYPREGPLLQQWSDWREYSYDNLADFTGELVRAVKGTDPSRPVIVAEMAWWWWGEQPYTGVSPLHIYQDADIVGYDLYPDSVEDASYFLLTSDMLSRHWQRPVWVMEMNRKDGNPSGEEIHRFMARAMDGGTSGIFFFQWQDNWRDGGDYGVLDQNGRRKPQYGGLAASVRWLKDRTAESVVAPPRKPDVYLVWPSSEIASISGDASPAWDIYKVARRIVEGGLKIGLVAEELMHVVDPAKLLTLRNGRLESVKGESQPSPPPPPRPRTTGWLISE